MPKFDIKNLGAGLLNETTKQLAQRDLDIVYIPYEKLRVDKRNQYSTNGIDELAEAIADVGLQQPLNVAQADDGMYDILGGQRRYLAIGQLLKSGNTKYSEVPCSIANPKNIDLPVDDETKYLYIIATTNEYRDLTDGDKLLRIRQLSEVYDKINKAGGAERIGKRRRDFIAESTNMSPRSVQDFLSIEKKLDPALKDAVIQGDLDIHTGVKIAALPDEKQKELASRYTDANDTGKDFNLAEEAQKINMPTIPDKDNQSDRSVLIDKEYVDNIFSQSKDLRACIRMMSSGLPVSQKSKERLDKLKADYEKLQSKFISILDKEIQKSNRRK